MHLLFPSALGTHILFGTLAIVCGLLPIIASKGGKLHRWTGRRYRQCMYFVLGSAAVMTVLAFKPYFAALTLGAGISTFSGLRVLKRKRPDLDPAQRARPLDWLVTLGSIPLLLILIFSNAGPGQPSVVFHALLGGAAAYIFYDLIRFTAPTRWPFFPRLWFYEHLVKMLASYSAVLSAFSGSVLTFVPLPSPWKQLWATILFHTLMITFIIWYAWLRDRLDGRKRLAT